MLPFCQEHKGLPRWVMVGPGSQDPSHHQSGAEQPGGARSSPAPAIRHFPEDMGLWLGLAWQVPWLVRVELWGAGDQPCCNITGVGADSSEGLQWGFGPWGK